MKGRRIRRLEELAMLADGRRAVLVGPLRCRMPASFLLSMQGRTILHYLSHGVFIYKPKRKTKTKSAPLMVSDDTTRCCEAGIRTLQGAEWDGNVWTCTCGKSWVYVEDEAEGGAWHRGNHGTNTQ